MENGGKSLGRVEKSFVAENLQSPLVEIADSGTKGGKGDE